MMSNLKAFGAVALSTMVLGACATKGYVRERVTNERVARMSADSALSNDVSAVRSEVATVRNDVTSLRNELQALRTEFGAKITAMEEGMKFAFPVTFAFDDATVRDADFAALDRFAAVVQKYYPGSTITIEGFADPAGSKAYNRDLSKRRADAVATYLSGKGMTNTNLRTIGYGAERQVNEGAQKDDPGAEANRRVVFVVESKGGSTNVAMQ